MDNAFLYILIFVAIASVMVMLVLACIDRRLALGMPYVASIYSIVFIYFALRSASQLAAKITSAEHLHVYLKYSLPPVPECFAGSITILASIPWLIHIANRERE